jgi:DNA polymerase-3 subunit epsilon
MATYEVLVGQLEMYGDKLKNDVNFLSSVGGRPKSIDYAGRLIYNDAGEAVVSFGKHKGKTAREVYRTDPSYFAWIDGGEFTLDTKRQFSILKHQFDKERKATYEARQASMDRPATEDELASLANRFNTGKLF